MRAAVCGGKTPLKVSREFWEKQPARGEFDPLRLLRGEHCRCSLPGSLYCGISYLLLSACVTMIIHQGTIARISPCCHDCINSIATGTRRSVPTAPIKTTDRRTKSEINTPNNITTPTAISIDEPKCWWLDSYRAVVTCLNMGKYLPAAPRDCTLIAHTR